MAAKSATKLSSRARRRFQQLVGLLPPRLQIVQTALGHHQPWHGRLRPVEAVAALMARQPRGEPV